EAAFLNRSSTLLIEFLRNPKTFLNTGGYTATALLRGPFENVMTFMDEEMKTYVESEVTVYIATRDADLQPEAGFAWGPRLVNLNEIEVFVDREASAKIVANLRENRQVAL